MKVYVVCQNDEETAVYTPEVFADEGEALDFLREQFLGKLDREELFDLGKNFGIVSGNAEFSEDAVNKAFEDINNLLRTHSVQNSYYTFNRYGAYIEYPFDDANFWHIEMFEREI